MKHRLRNLALLLSFGQALAACQVSTNPWTASVVNPPTAQAAGDVVRTAPLCSEDQGGRHFGEPTPFSGNPFNGCWPQ